MSKRILIILSLIFCFSTKGSISKDLKLQVSLEQINVKITKSFSIRVNSINQITLNISKNVSMEDIYLERSNGTFFKLDVAKIKGKTKVHWELDDQHIKTITFTARTNSTDSNHVEFALKK